MPETPAKPPASPAPRAAPRLSRRHGTIVAVAFAIGLLLFLWLWASRRGDNDFYRAEAPVAGPEGQVFEPLPVPMPGDEADATDTPDADERAPGMVGIDETRPAPPPAPVAPPPSAAPPVPPAMSQATSDPVLVGKASAPYPVDALRNGEQGTVMLRVTVGADGVPYGIALARSSRSRSLDRAAMAAVRNWRFRPAMRNGEAVPATVQIPVSYRLGER